jgi:predicted MPP superfamily phosphohydrolase
VQLIGFVLILAALVGLAHVYLWLRLVRDTTAAGSGRVRRAGAVVAVLLGLLVPATLVGSRALPPPAARFLAWPGYLWVGLMFYLLLGLLLTEPVRLVFTLLGRARRRRVSVAAAAGTAGAADRAAAGSPSGVPPSTTTPGGGGTWRHTIPRRVVLARATAAMVGAAAGGVVGYGARTALGPPRITALDVPLRRLPAGLDGLRIAVVSDLHLGPLLGRWHTERVVRMINELGPDVVAIVGDLVDGTPGELGGAVAPLRDLVSTHGSFFVTGNHEYYAGAAAWLAELPRLGVHPLVNERVEIRAGGAVLDLAGVNDVTAARSRDPGATAPDYDRALRDRDPPRPVVLLAHQPVQVHESARRGVDLQLSGHTHGGQLFPFHAAVRLQQPVLRGLHRFGDTQLFVTSGAGFWGPPVRVGAPPEIALVRLTTAPPTR